jgi:hypothetical protein
MTGMEAANRRGYSGAVAAIAIAAAAIAALGLAASRSVAAATEAPPSPHATGYLPSIGDLMIATIQPRHERLWRAGQDGNWEFAAYELGNLRGAFTRLGQAHPSEHDISFADMIASVTEQPINELNTAIKSKDGRCLRQGLCQSDRRMQFVPSGSQPRRRQHPCAGPDIRIGHEYQWHVGQMTLGVPSEEWPRQL